MSSFVGAASSVRLRLQRFGRAHKPFYRIVAAPRKGSRDGKFFEILGNYNPIPDPFGNKQVELKVDRVKYWMSVGAEPSERVSKLLGIAEILPPPPRRYLTRDLPPEPEPAAADETHEGVERDDAQSSELDSEAGAAAEKAPS
jgi:small subunit ribosomal protein S16